MLRRRKRLEYLSSRKVTFLWGSPTGVLQFCPWWFLIRMVCFFKTSNADSFNYLQIWFPYIFGFFHCDFFSGKLSDVVLGYDSVKDYTVSLLSTSSPKTLCCMNLLITVFADFPTLCVFFSCAKLEYPRCSTTWIYSNMW